MRKQRVWRNLVVGLSLAATSPGALIEFSSRALFDAATDIAAALPSANGVDFTATTVCPLQTPSNNLVGCAPSAGNNDYANSAAIGTTLTFSSLTGFSIQGFFGQSSSTQRLILYDSNYDHPSATRTKLTYGTPVLSSRNVADNATTSALRIRVNLPAGTRSFAMDLSKGCHVNTTQSDAASGCDSGDNHLGTIQLNTSNGDSRLITTTDGSPTTGEFAFFGAQSDAAIIWIDLTLPTGNFGSIVATRFAFGDPTPTPEPSTLLLTAAGLAILLRRRTR